MFHDSDNDSEVDPSVAGVVAVEESDEDQEVAVGFPPWSGVAHDPRDSR